MIPIVTLQILTVDGANNAAADGCQWWRFFKESKPKMPEIKKIKKLVTIYKLQATPHTAAVGAGRGPDVL